MTCQGGALLLANQALFKFQIGNLSSCDVVAKGVQR